MLKQLNNSDEICELGDLICRIANDVEKDDAKLREKIITLIEAGNAKNAVALLIAWNTTAAGDLLTTLMKDAND